MRAVKASDATFMEKRDIALLDKPIESSGTLHYRAPDYLEKNTLSPQEDHLVVSGKAVSLDPAKGRTRHFTVDQAPEAAALIESIRGTLAGDDVALLHYYDVQIHGTLSNWQLVLVPTTPRVQALVDSIQISGSGNAVQTVETNEHGGDHTVMTITSSTR